MATTTTINAFPVPELADAPNIETAVGNFADAVDARVIPIFSTTTARGTAIPSPTEGQMAYVTGTDELYIYSGTAWISAKPRIAAITSLETVTDSTTLTNSTAIRFSVEANSTYVINGTVAYSNVDATNANDFKYAWSIPASAGGRVVYHLGPSTLTSATGDVNIQALAWDSTAVAGVLSGAALGFTFGGVFTTAGTAGNIIFQFAENTSVGGVTSVTLQTGTVAYCYKVA